ATEAVLPENLSNEWLTVKVRYQLPTTDVNVQPESVKIEFPLTDEQSVDSLSDVQQADFLWSASVTMYGLLLRDSKYRGRSNYDAVLEMANAGKRDDSTGRKAEFLELVNRAKLLAR
ncbi:MAG: DUF3520 domain-containing protein, partial [Planctomycetota bacterium]|nr:DUF3520 domain-containing protein [Planctomycetota bacterium]